MKSIKQQVREMRKEYEEMINGLGCVAPNTLVKVSDDIYFMGNDRTVTKAKKGDFLKKKGRK